jgi:hypothetical protein
MSGIANLIGKKLEEKNEVRITSGAGREPCVKVDVTQPWAAVAMPNSIGVDMCMSRVVIDDTGENLCLEMPNGQLGPAFDKEGLRLLGHHTGFKVDFIHKLPINMQADVVSEMMRQHRSQDFQFVGDDKINSVSPGWRDIAGHPEVCQVAYDAMKIASKSTDVEVRNFRKDNTGMSCWFVMHSISDSVTKQRGDVIRAGIALKHRYGSLLQASLFIDRLVCLNGMVVTQEGFSWAQRGDGNINRQMDYLVFAVNEAVDNFPTLINRAKSMANTTIDGDPRDALLARARAMKIDPKYFPDIISAYEIEGGSNEWMMLQAITRWATHNNVLEADKRDNVLASSGSWAYDFDLVNARLPRPLAERFGAQIMEEKAN